MTAGPNPSIGAEAARKALGASQEKAANERDTIEEQAVLNETELQELEHEEYYRDEPPAPARPSLLDRLLGRRGR